MKQPPTPQSPLILTSALVAIVLIVAAAVMFTSGDQTLERLAVLTAVVGAIVPSIAGGLKSGQAAHQTNGGLDERMREAARQVIGEELNVRRADDVAIISRPDPGDEPPHPDPLTVPG